MEPLDLRDRFQGLNIEELEVLDLGCGRMNSPLSSQMRRLPFKRLEGIDCAAPGIHELLKARLAARESRFWVRDVRDVIKDYADGSRDVVIMMDFIEHLSKEEGHEIIKQAKRIARKRVLVWLPVGPCAQPGDRDNPAMEHVSTWSGKDLEKLGFRVTEWPAFHQHVVPPANAAWAIWNKDEIKTILVERLDVHGDVLVATSVLPGLAEKYPGATIDWHVRAGFDFALQNNPYIHRIIQGPAKDPDRLHKKYDLVVAPEHHYRWDKPMAQVHCEVAGVPFHEPKLYFTPEELHSVAEKYRDRVLVANKAGWKSRECPNLTKVLVKIAPNHPEFLQIDKADDMSPKIEHYVGSLRQVAAIMSYAKLYIGIDTVFMHMAAALHIPMALCLGPTGPETQWIPTAKFIRPFVHLNPAEPSAAFENGIDLPEYEIGKLLSEVLSSPDSSSS